MSTAVAEIPAVQKSQRIAVLDGWRGIAILLVLEDHFWFSRHFQARSEMWNGGWLGVTIFFVLSGYLITKNLLAKDPIDLRRFYTRRIRRLWPSAWAYLLFIFLIHLLVHQVVWSDVAKCVFFVRNYTHGLWATEHFWTLSIEEQFYLVWPAVLLFAGRRRAAWIAGSGIVAVAAYRIAYWSQWSDPVHFRLSWHTQFRADSLLVGCLFAILIFNFPRLLSNAKMLLVGGSFSLVLAIAGTKVSPTAELFAIILFLLYSLGCNRLNSVLSFRPLAALGRISYSLYLWQEFYFMLGYSKLHLWLYLIPATLTAIASYYLIEKPFMAH